MFGEPPGSYDICEICYWEDDIVQLAFPDLAGGANKCSLIDGQHHYAEFGTCERRLLPHVRPAGTNDIRDASWRPLNVDSDQYLHWESREDHDLWDSVKYVTDICLYYWRGEYWLRDHKT